MEAVELASKRAAATVHGEMKRGLNSLATIASTATLIGLLGTVTQMIDRTFYSCGGNWSSCYAPIGGRLAEAMSLTALGFLVAIPAFWLYRYLSSRMEAFDREMENASLELMNRLAAHFGPVSRPAAKVSRAPKPPFDNPVEGPRLSIQHMYRNGVFELIWPRLESESDADSILHGGMWISLAYALIGWLTCSSQGRPIAGSVVVAFFTVAALGVRTGSLTAILGIFAFLAFASIACLTPFGLSAAPVFLAVAPLLLLGSLKAARFLSATRTSIGAVSDDRRWVCVINLWTSLRPLPSILVGLLGFSASMAVLFGTALALYPMGVDDSMEPALHTGDWIVSINRPLMGAAARGDLVVFRYWNVLGTERVVGLPGDRIRVESGKLILNGKAVAEPYCKQPYRGGLGDFPLPSEAFPDGFLRWEHWNAYRNGLKLGKAFVVPKDSYFLLNDDRNELMDSRIFGPLRNSDIAGRPLLAYGAQKNSWSFPRFVF